MKTKKSEVWMHKKTGELYEHFDSIFGMALTKVDLDNAEPPFTNWHDWVERGLFAFNDCKLYDKKKFINLGDL